MNIDNIYVAVISITGFLMGYEFFKNKKKK